MSSISNLPPKDSGSSTHMPAGNAPSSHKGKDPKAKAALEALANTANTTAEDDIFSQKEVTVANPGLLGGAVSYAASYLTEKAISGAAYLVLPHPGGYSPKITQLKDSLFTLTGAHIASETAKVIAKNQVDRFSYFLSNLHLLTVADTKSGTLKHYITEQDGKIVLTYKGMGFLTILKEHKALLEETFEVNILRAMGNAITYLKTIASEHPFLAVELVQDTLHHIVVAPPSDKTAESLKATQDDHDKFMGALSTHIEKAIFPAGAGDIEIPTYFRDYISSSLFLQIQKKVLPRKMTKMYDTATSEVMKYKMLARAVQELKAILTTEPEPKKHKEASVEETEKIDYPKDKQKQFNKELLGAVKAFFKEIDFALSPVLELYIFKKIEKQGPKIVEKLLNIDLNALLNKGLTSSCKKLKSTSSKTALQREEAAKKSLEQNQKEVREAINTIASDLNGLISRLATSKSEKAARSSHTRISKIKKALHSIFKQIKKGLIRFAFMVFGVDKRISSLSEKVLNFAEKLDLKEASARIKRIDLTKKLSKPKSPPHTPEQLEEPLF